ncbi:unnamed protein product, partial [Allacma fusca]
MRIQSSIAHKTLRSQSSLIYFWRLIGIETTSSTLEWAILFLSQFSTCQEKLQKDIDRVIGRAKYGYSSFYRP